MTRRDESVSVIPAEPRGARPLGVFPLGALSLGAFPLGALSLGAFPLRALSSGALLSALFLVAAPLAAQETWSLGAPVAESAEAFSAVAGLRPLSDGSVLVADGLEGRLLHVSPDLGSSTLLGREGAGPREYRTPDALFATSADSSIMVDLGNGRLSTLAPDGSIVRTMPIAAGSEGDLTIMMPRAVDRDGRIYFREMGRPGPGGPPDSATVVRFDPRSEEAEKLARVKLPEMSVRTSGGPNNREEMTRPVPLSVEDAWTVSTDGRLAVARSEGDTYWLELYGPGGVTSGPRVEYAPVPVRSADRDEWIASLSGALGVSVDVDNGRVRTSFSRGGAPSIDPDDLEWPDTKPAFPGGALRAVPNGHFWLERHVPAGSPPRFDVLDGTGRRIGSVELPEGRRFAGFGDDTVYLVRTDALDFAWLERYPMPAS